MRLVQVVMEECSSTVLWNSQEIIYNTLQGKIGFGNKIVHSVVFVQSKSVFHADSESGIPQCPIL
eukprot:CAMPEP_0204645716 /NCGR_PEP_ID=MMETSP0718-20130828/3398_1 /ASSEMBLY_ACC=CAM_ASM_000674 /TAXON_ID=230516 /ORGANISM="Chaetoceros curvisetus" /LENGTH=64 /DNA_ID=CAMNT_0051667745 /DNA_START=39 /DNA_END=229 /DNA_ORIENTATION=-